LWAFTQSNGHKAEINAWSLLASSTSWLGEGNPGSCPRWRITTDEDCIVTRTQRATEAWIIKAQCLLSRLPDTWQSDDEEIIVGEDEMV
jgi:hypothetical protein